MIQQEIDILERRKKDIILIANILDISYMKAKEMSITEIQEAIERKLK